MSRNYITHGKEIETGSNRSFGLIVGGILATIFSSEPYRLRVLRRISLITCSAGDFPATDFCLIFAPSSLR